MGSFSNILVLIVISLASTHAWDDGLLKRVGQTDTKMFFTSPWAPELDWMQAQEFCNQAQLGMQMASIETERERQIVYMFFVSYADQRKWYEFWVSATDYGREGNFTWTKSGQSVPFAVKQEPGDLSKQQNCLKVLPSGAGSFEDESCYGFTSTGLWPLCEIKIEAPTTTVAPPTPAPTTTTPAPPDQEFKCTSEGMHADLARCDMYHVCVAHQGGFLDHEFNCPQFTNYCRDQQSCGHPTDCPCDLKSQMAVAMDNTEESSVVESDRPEFEQFPVQNLGTVGSKTFYTDTKSRNLNWIESMEFCHQNDLIMARMETDAERTFLLRKLSVDYYIDYFWLSGVDYGNEGSYYWVNSGAKLDRSIYGNGGRDSNCVYLSGSGPLYDWSCTNHRNYKMWPLCQSTAEV